MLEVHCSKTSVLENVGKLCHIFNRTSKKYNVNKLKAELFGILLRFSKEPSQNNRSVNVENLNEIDVIYAEIHCMLNLGEYDRAYELRKLFQMLMDPNGQISDEILQCIRFFLCLARWSSKQSATLGGPWQIPKFKENLSGITDFIPEQFSIYGETRVYNPNFYYMQYPNEIFESVNQPSLSESGFFNSQVFEAAPGYDETGNPLYNYFKKGKCSLSGNENSWSLFGSTNKDHPINDFSLQLPVLTPYSAQNPMSFTLHSSKNSSYHEDQNSNDEGFIDAENNRVIPTYDNADIWEKVSKLPLPPRRSWDYKHKLVGSKAPVYPCQSGPMYGHIAYASVLKQLKTINPELKEQDDAYCSDTDVHTFDLLIQDVVHLLLGVPSRTFFYDKQKHQFRLRAKLSVPFLSTEPLSQVLKDFLDCGSLYLKLESFAQPHVLGSYLSNGLVVECFKDGVHQYLQYYRSCILCAKETQSCTLLSLHQAVYKAYRQLRYLTDFCLGDRHLLSRVGQECVLPKGLKLLNFLFQSALQEWGGDNYFLLLFLLKTSCAPYFRFLHDWVFEGTLNDPYSEFNIQVNEIYLINPNCRSLFWSNGYVLKEKMNLVPFLGETVTQNVLLCGKSLNLLKICDPKHSLLDSHHHRPSLALSLTNSGLQKTFNESSCYYNTLNHLLFKTVEAPCLSTVSEKKDSLVVPKDSVSIQPEVGEKNVSKNESCQSQINWKDVNEKTDVAIQEASGTVSETVSEETTLFTEMKEQVQLEITEHYNKLIQNAENEKQKILWRAKRFELHEKRSELVKDGSETGENTISNHTDTGEDTILKHTDTGEDTISNHTDTGEDTKIAADITVCQPPAEKCERTDALPADLALPDGLLHADVILEVLDSNLNEETEIFEDETNNNRSSEQTNHTDLECYDKKPIFDLDAKLPQNKEEVKEQSHEDTDDFIDFEKILSVTVPEVQPYESDYFKLMSGSLPIGDLLVSLKGFGPSLDWDKEQELECLSVPLPVFFHRSFNPPLQAQTRLVNQAVLYHFNHDLKLVDHLNVLRNIFLFNDGEFGRTLSQLIYKKASKLHQFRDLMNPYELRSILNTALSSCHSGESPLAENLCLGQRLDCNTEPAPGFGVLSNLELKYKVDWPLDIVISEESEELYNTIFGFLLKINHVIWTLTDSWYHLKHYDQLLHISGHWQFRQIQVFRHEMLHFSQSVYEFVCCQILQLSWQEFQIELQEKVEDLDQLRNAHMNYLQKACTRCMLGSNMDISLQRNIDLAFQMCLNFHSQVFMLPWNEGMPLQGDSFYRLASTYHHFKNQVKVLCKALKLTSSGKRCTTNGHLFDFLLTLDVSEYYN